MFDGEGGEARAEIVAINRSSAALRLLAAIDKTVESSLDSCLVQAVTARPSRMDAIVRQVTELGVGRIVPVLAERSQRTAGGPAARARRGERWRRVAQAAAEQSGRTRVPAIDPVTVFDQLEWRSLPRPLFIAQPQAPPASIVPAAAAVSVLVGPEGGWSVAEVEAAVAEGAEKFSLGPRTLRSDTAGPVAVALFQYLWGDLGHG